MQIRRHVPSSPLSDYVRSFSERTAMLADCEVSAPLPARVDQLIELYLEDPYRVSHGGGPASATPELAIVGPQRFAGTRIHLSGSLRVFTIHLQPAGLSALFGIDTSNLTDRGVEAQLVIGRCANELRDSLMRTADFESRVDTTQRWLADRICGAKPMDVVGRSAKALLDSGGTRPVADFARSAGLSDRQFTRRFEYRTGLTPKVFARAARFAAALEAKSTAPSRSWTEVAYDAGYADQSHLIRDSRLLAGAPPRRFYADWSAIP